jgi:ATP-dependent DNA ligase
MPPRARSVILDDEAVTLDKDGRSDFGALRGELDDRSTRLRFCVFDLLELDGIDLRPATARAQRTAPQAAARPARHPARGRGAAGRWPAPVREDA